MQNRRYDVYRFVNNLALQYKTVINAAFTVCLWCGLNGKQNMFLKTTVGVVSAGTMYLLIVWGHLTIASPVVFSLFLMCALVVWQWVFTLQSADEEKSRVSRLSVSEAANVPLLHESMLELAQIQDEMAALNKQYGQEH